MTWSGSLVYQTLLVHGPAIPLLLLLGVTCGICVIVAMWWIRDHRIAAQRNAQLMLNALGEEILCAASPRDIQKRLAEVLPSASALTCVRLFIYNRKMCRLDSLRNAADDEPVSIDPESPASGFATGVALAFRSRTLLKIPNTRRSRLMKSRDGFVGPRSVLFVPMLAQNEPMGVLEAGRVHGIRYFSHEECVAMQHLANQVAIALQLQEHQRMHQQTFCREKVAPMRQLISSVGSELQAPIENMLVVAQRLAARHEDPALQRELRVLTAEASRASEIVARLGWFDRGDLEQPQVVDINGLMSSLTIFREREWKAFGIDVQSRLHRGQLYTKGPQVQLEQMFLNVLVHAGQSVVDAPAKILSITTSAVGQRAVVEIDYSCGVGNGPPSARGLDTWRAVVHRYGGQTRFSQPSPTMCRLEIDFPLSGKASNQAASSEPRRSRVLTALVIEPDTAAQRRLVIDLGEREHRAVPVNSAEEGLDLAHRLRFDLVFCSTRLPGLNWTEFHERVYPLVGVFVLMVDEFDSHPSDLLVLNKFSYDAELDRVLAEVEAPLAGKAASPVA